jgi:hypothetical protein
MVSSARKEEVHRCEHGHVVSNTLVTDQSSRLSQLDNEVADLETLIAEMMRLKESLRD